MDFSQMTVAQVEKAAELLKEKERLLARVEEINYELKTLFQPEITVGRAGKVKTAILAELQKAGVRGLTTREIAENLGMLRNNVASWFSLTGKKDKRIVKNAEGKWIFDQTITDTETDTKMTSEGV